jgi:hypothetical protein
MDYILEKIEELKNKVKSIDPDFNDISRNNEEGVVVNYFIEQEVSNKTKIEKIISKMTNKIKKIILIYSKNFNINNNSININNYISHNITRLMLIKNVSSINNLPRTIFHLGFIDNKCKIKFNKIHKNIKFLELKNSNQFITGFKVTKYNTKTNKILFDVHTACNLYRQDIHHSSCLKCDAYGKNGSGTICHNILINKRYNINYDREVCVDLHKSKTINVK